MAHFDLASITTGTERKPPRAVIYGPHKIGKTTFGASAPSPIFIRTEDGLATLRVPSFPLCKSYGDVMSAITTLYTQSHPFQTAVLDSLDWLESIVWAHTALVGGYENIESPGYGKGYVEADEHWKAIFDGFTALRDDKGMAVIFLAHTEVKTFNAPDTEPYDRYQIKLHKRAAALVQEWADVIGFAHYEVFTTATEQGFNKKVTRGVGSGRRLLSVEERPAFQAGNRYSLPADLDLSWPAFAAACGASYARAEAAQEPVYAASPSDNMDAPIPQNEAAEQEMDEALFDEARASELIDSLTN